MTTDIIQLDGSIGEGGGQILRTALSLSMVTGRPFEIENIRAGRKKPGLMRQHLTAVHAAREISGAQVQGAAVGSTAVTFAPGHVRAGDYRFSIGTAGSTTLVLQTALPALIVGTTPSTLTLEGGTHNIHAPSVHFLTHTFVPLLAEMGATVDVRLERHGFYPAGGGRIDVTIAPAERLRTIEITERGRLTHRRAIASVAGLPRNIAEREVDVVRRLLGWEAKSVEIEQLTGAHGPGNILSIELGDGRVTEVITGFGEKRVAAERVARTAAKAAREYIKLGAPVGPHLADQLMIPMALAGGGVYRTGPLTRHAETNAHVVEAFLDVNIHRERSDTSTTVTIAPK